LSKKTKRHGKKIGVNAPHVKSKRRAIFGSKVGNSLQQCSGQVNVARWIASFYVSMS